MLESAILKLEEEKTASTARATELAALQDKSLVSGDLIRRVSVTQGGGGDTRWADYCSKSKECRIGGMLPCCKFLKSPLTRNYLTRVSRNKFYSLFMFGVFIVHNGTQSIY